MPDTGLASGFLTFVRGGNSNRFQPKSDETNPPAELPDVMKLALAIDLRMRGSVAEALELLDSIGAVEPLRPVFDASGGWDLMITVQHGITAILAGRFDSALTILTRARFQAPFGSLVCLSRDALVKIALLQAAFGDQREARIALDHATALPRSNSWIEPRIDATATLAEAMLDSTPAQRALDTVHSLPLADIGEMWPFYAIALHRSHVRTGREQELPARLSVLESVPFPYLPGTGFAGSVLPLLRAVRATEHGDFRSAAWFAAAADHRFIGTSLVLLRINARGNRARRVPRAASRLVEQPGFGSLRRFELWRSASLIEAHLALGREEEALALLRSSIGIPGGLSESERALFSGAIERFGAVQPSSAVIEDPVFSAEPADVSAHHPIAVGPGAPADPTFSAEPAFFTDQASTPVLGPVAIQSGQAVPANKAEATEPTRPSSFLTPREREVVALLGTELSRAEIAETLYISINTLKKHLRIIYHKLDVTRRDAAILRARAEGWITTPSTASAPAPVLRRDPTAEQNQRTADQPQHS